MLCYYAIKHGKLNIVKWVWDKYEMSADDFPLLFRACRKAAECNHMSVFTWIDSKTIRFDSSYAFKGAAKSGNVELLNWLYVRSHDDVLDSGHDIVNEAATNGHLHVLEWILAKYNKNLWGRKTCHSAAKNGHLEVLQWLRSRDPPCPWGESTFAAASGHNHKAITDWLQTLVPSCPFNSTVLLYAVRNGDLKLVQWLRSQTPPCPFPDDIISQAFGNKNVEMRKWLVDNNAPCNWNSKLCSIAVSHNDLNTLKWLRSLTPPCPWDSWICEIAVRSDNIEVLEWLVSQGCELNNKSYHWPASSGQLDMLVWLHRRDAPSFYKVQKSLMESAIYNGHMHIIKWLRSLDPPCEWNKSFIQFAVTDRRLKILIWLRSQDPPCPWDECELYQYASSTGDVMLMKCLRDLNPSYPWDDSLCAIAAEYGQLRMLRWLRCQDPPCPINLNDCIELAAEQKHVEVVDWLRIQTGCANCSENNCSCENPEIKLPVNYEEDRNIIISQRIASAEDRCSEDDDKSSIDSADQLIILDGENDYDYYLDSDVDDGIGNDEDEEGHSDYDFYVHDEY
jgi:hypothetical protein